MANVIAHEVGMGLWEDEACTEEWKGARSVLRMSNSDYDQIVSSLRENIDKSNEFFDIIK
jgi:hypothetical protein